ncbi:MAG: thiamine-monophosphate kinase [Candidatus Latescibacterota bacterium]|nr:MAG: thiamine-monophosphate kinase [Candidatus Latescibacterota bacterium]
MVGEQNIISIIRSVFEREEVVLSTNFDADAERVRLGDDTYLFTTDEYSSEDLFRTNDPVLLGWNVATGSISDILAAGGVPLVYAHAMIVDPSWSDEYIRKFSRGVAKVLKTANVTFAGGDIGRAKTWHYTASVLGKAEAPRLGRRGARAGDSVFLSGRIGSGNLEAGLSMFAQHDAIGRLARTVRNKFHLRLDESALIRRYATACMDTSDGTYNALSTICELNGTGFAVSNLPYLRKGILFAQILGMPKTLLFLGECGEYELLFTIRPADEKGLVKEARSNGFTFYRIGRLTEDPETKTILEDGTHFKLRPVQTRARDYENLEDYLAVLVDSLERLP